MGDMSHVLVSYSYRKAGISFVCGLNGEDILYRLETYY